MPSFKQGDSVFILPRFARLFPANSAVVLTVNTNTFRPMLNEYTVEFPDHSAAKVFEFQIIEDLPSYTTTVARVIFDSRAQQTQADVPGNLQTFQIVLQTPEYDLEMRIHTTTTWASVTGQVIERRAKAPLKNIDVRLMRDGTYLSHAPSDSAGTFKFPDVVRGTVNIVVAIPQSSLRILGAFTV
jgi:hypothetical protein